jgi:hypothetical protein
MTSQIVSATIDENYPIAGQDNDSQGFRNNFSIIKDGLATANSEVTNLQLNAAKLNVANNFNGTLIDNAQTNRLYGTVFPISRTSGTTVIDYSNGEYQTVDIGGNHSLRFTGFPQKEDNNGRYSKIRLELKPVAPDSGIIPSDGWNVSLLAAGGGTVTGTVGFDQVGDNPVINIGNDIELATVIEAWTTDGLNFFVGLVGAYNAELNLESLTDVTLATLANNQVLKYNSTLGKWVNGTPEVSLTTINSLENVADIDYEGLVPGDILKWNGTTWSPITFDLNSLDDVVIDTLNTNHTLKYNGTTWINTALMLEELGNVTTSSPAEGDVIRYDADGDTWKNEKDPNLIITNVFTSTFVNIADAFHFNTAPGQPGSIRITDVAASPILTFNIGNIYRFDLSHSSNATDFKFTESLPSITTGTIAAYTTNVRSFGTAGQPGSYIEIQITKDTPDVLYVYGINAGLVTDAKFLGRDVPIFINKRGFYTGSEDLANAAAASLFRSTSYFSTAAAETATLAAGAEGQVKVFAMYADTGDMVITVANPGWSGSGTITFDTVGQACTLQYINSKWFCIGNNGAVFA